MNEEKNRVNETELTWRIRIRPMPSEPSEHHFPTLEIRLIQEFFVVMIYSQLLE